MSRSSAWRSGAREHGDEARACCRLRAYTIERLVRGDPDAIAGRRILHGHLEVQPVERWQQTGEIAHGGRCDGSSGIEAFDQQLDAASVEPEIVPDVPAQ